MSRVWFQTSLAGLGGNLTYAELPNAAGGGSWDAGAGNTITITRTLTVSGLLTASAGLTLTGTLTMGTAASILVPGTTSFSIRNNANNADNFIVTDAGAATVRTTLTVTTAFGCNGKAAQAAVVAGAAAPAGGVGAAAGAWDTAGNRDTAITMINQMRTTLIAMGIMS